MQTDTIPYTSVDRDSLDSFLRDLYLTVSSPNIDSRDACVDVVYMIEDFCAEQGIPFLPPTESEISDYPPEESEYENSEEDPEY